MGAVSLWLIGYVLSTFNFGAIQAFMTQMVYGLILVLSLLLTLLVPVISRYVNFISPWSAFLVLALVVVGIMLHVATHGTYSGGEHHLVVEALADRYFLFPPPVPARVKASPLPPRRGWRFSSASRRSPSSPPPG